MLLLQGHRKRVGEGGRRGRKYFKIRSCIVLIILNMLCHYFVTGPAKGCWRMRWGTEGLGDWRAWSNVLCQQLQLSWWGGQPSPLFFPSPISFPCSSHAWEGVTEIGYTGRAVTRLGKEWPGTEGYWNGSYAVSLRVAWTMQHRANLFSTMFRI